MKSRTLAEKVAAKAAVLSWSKKSDMRVSGRFTHETCKSSALELGACLHPEKLRTALSADCYAARCVALRPAQKLTVGCTTNCTTRCTSAGRLEASCTGKHTRTASAPLRRKRTLTQRIGATNFRPVRPLKPIQTNTITHTSRKP